MKKSIFLFVSMMFLIAAQAQEKKAASKNKPSEDLENLQMANQLAKFGYKTFSASALLEASKIMSSIKTQDLKYESIKLEPTVKEQALKKSKEGYDLASILSAAKKYADGDAKLLAAIADVEKANQATRGRVGGPAERTDLVPANSTLTYTMNFIEGELAEIGVVGDSDTDLDLFVFDSSDNKIATDTDYTDRCYVSWIPKWTGRYRVVVVNRGMVSNQFTIRTN
jgi:hypothetical protein